MASGGQLTLRLFLWHWAYCLGLVLLTYNPLGYSYYHWVTDGSGEVFLKMIMGLGLLIAYTFLMWVIIGSIGRLGLLAGVIMWVLLAHEVIKFFAVEGSAMYEFIVLLCLSTLLAIGLAWPYINFQLHGQIEKRYTYKEKKKY